ncbi:UDP-glycosyltransferase 91C1 [Linum perenne]
MGNKERAKERREKRREEISFLRTVPYSDHERWWNSDTVAVVTGSNRGIGFEIVKQLASHGLTVILTSRNPSSGIEAAKSLQELGLSVVSHELDVLDTSSVDRFVEWIKHEHGGIDILVNNAGVNFNLGNDNSVEFAPLVIDTNYHGTKTMTKAMIPLMRRTPAGARIVNVSSRLGRVNGRRNRLGDVTLRDQLSSIGTLSEELIDTMLSNFLREVEDGSWESSKKWPQVFTDYALSKLGVNCFTRLMAKSLSDRIDGEKIYVNSFCPGWVKTAMTGWAGNISPEEAADTGVWLSLLRHSLSSSSSMAANHSRSDKLEIVVFPWLAMGHLIPFLHLSKLLAQKGHKIHFISTPRNISRLPELPRRLSDQITFLPFPLPPVPGLRPGAESTMDIPYNQQQLLKKAFDSLRLPLTELLRKLNPDWVIYDYASHWLPSAAAAAGGVGGCVFFSLFTAATLCFVGPPGGGDSRRSAEDLTVIPDWVPIESNVKYRLHEVTKYVEKTEEDSSGPSDVTRFIVAMEESDALIVRSSPEFEPEWFHLLGQLHKKTIIPIGFLPQEDENGVVMGEIGDWLDKQRVNSVVYVALGTEAALTHNEIAELASGLEKSGLPFLWILRNTAADGGSAQILPAGFENRTKGRGIVYREWAPQVKILSHDSVGGFLTHCGYNSVVEGLTYGRVLILFPMINDQGLNARLLEGKKLGMEIPRDERDGSFTSEAVAATVTAAVVGDSGAPTRAAVKAAADGMFGDRKKNGEMVDVLVRYLEDNKMQKP